MLNEKRIYEDQEEIPCSRCDNSVDLSPYLAEAGFMTYRMNDIDTEQLNVTKQKAMQS